MLPIQMSKIQELRSEHGMQAVTIAHFKVAELQDQEHVVPGS